MLTYGALIVLGAAFAERLIFVPPEPSYGADVEGFTQLATEAGDSVAAVYLEAENSPLTVMYAHGNGEDLGDVLSYLVAYRDLGVSVLAFDYPGYGLSAGLPSEEGAYAAADAAYDHLTGTLGIDSGRIVAHGQSLGGGVMVDLASRRAVAGLIVESSFVSAYRVMTRFPILPVDQFRSLKKLPSVAAPVFVIHGTADEVIAVWHGRKLAQAVPAGQRRTLWVEGAGHNDLRVVAGDSYSEAIRSYLESVAEPLRGE